MKLERLVRGDTIAFYSPSSPATVTWVTINEGKNYRW